MNTHHFSRLVSGRFASLCLLILLNLPLVAKGEITLYGAIEDYLRAQTQGLPGKVTYKIGELDPRTQLGACQSFEPFVPAGGRLWGKSTLGVRCLAPSTWTIYVPVHISINGNYLVSTRAMPAGQVVGAADIALRNGDLCRLPENTLNDPGQAIGKTVKNSFSAAQPLRSDLLIAPWAVQQGQSVKTLSNGPGFSVSSEGKALNNAIAGQIVQVRTPSGQTISGTARAGGIVEIAH